MVKILLDDLMTGACHAPVDSAGKVQSGVDWRKKEFFKKEP